LYRCVNILKHKTYTKALVKICSLFVFWYKWKTTNRFGHFEDSNCSVDISIAV
jgi:hypothetical protein